ncbi:MAG: 5'/3'-nucleotidase SurE, partial [Pyrinomonadaceae bacterium]
IHSEGIIKLEESLSKIGDVFTVAPVSEMSGASHSLTLSRPLRIRKIDDRHWSVDGTPTDCVTLALGKILNSDQRPAICVSGINHGGNIGDDASYSGTVAGAQEATILGIPAVAFSLVERDSFDFTYAARFAACAVKKVLDDGLPEGTLLNINVPSGEIRGVMITRQGVKSARPLISEHIDPRGKPYFWIGEEYFTQPLDAGTDYYAIEHGLVSVTPLHCDMTNHKALSQLESWNEFNFAHVM